MGNETVYKYLTINWVGRQAESIEFNNKKYIFNLCYEKIDDEETLHFWRLNEENKWERLTFVRNNMNEQDILDPDFELDHFYKWTSDNPGDNISKGKSTIYYFDI